MINAFRTTNESTVREAVIANNYWTLSLAQVAYDMYVTGYIEVADINLVEVYMDWLDEYCDWDLHLNGNPCISEAKFEL